MLHVHRAERADALVDALGALLAQPHADPFAPEVVAVPTRGIERWLTQRLSGVLGASPSRADGVCANVAFPSPRRLAREAVAAASGIDPERDPWPAERAVWPLLELVDAHLGEPWLAPLAAHLGGPGDDVRRARRFAAVRRVAERYERYAVHRPDLLRAWAAGAGAGWQAELWRRLRDRLAVASPAERVEAACARLRADPQAVALPPRLALLGLTRLPAGELEVLAALAAHRDVHLLLLHPSPALWERIAAARPRVARRREDPTATLAANPLLRSWGRDARELQLLLAPLARVEHHHAAPARADTLLARIQADVRADRAPAPAAGAGRAPAPAAVADRAPAPAAADRAPGDRSLQVHACHGRARQVEVMRDAILHLLADDPTLEPRDVIVLCPDIETFAPLVQAAFGAGDPDADGGLRVRLADRALRQTNPVLGVVARLLELADARLTASEVLDLADREPVRRRFELDDDDLARIEEWVRASGVRWGLDAEHRAPFRLAGVPAGTWRAGLDRVLLGVAMTEDEPRTLGGALALDDVDSGAIDLAGRLAELIDRLAGAIARLAGPQPVVAWAQALADAADALADTAPRDAWQRAELARLLDDVVAESGGHAGELALPELRALLADRLRGRPTRASFRTGHLTICTLVPMRSVPHRVVGLLGLDDGVFPRQAPRDGDDVMLDEPRIGERDPRAEDRQLLLDALMAAREHLVITYTGNDERTNLPRPPAVPVAELLDVAARTSGAPRERLVVRHPLQPFDPRNFAAAAPWSFDAVTLRGAVALTGERRPPAPFLAEPLPPLASPVVELADLVAFVRHPVRAFLRRRLGFAPTELGDDVDDALPVELDALERWAVGDRLLAARLAGVGGREALLAEIARGTLPPEQLGRPLAQGAYVQVEAILAAAPAGAPASVDVRVALPDGRTLTGTVAGVCGDELRTLTYSRVAAPHRLEAWVRLLALAAAHPGRAYGAVTVGRAERGEGVAVARVGPLDAAAALDHLAVLVDLYDRGMREPPPLACRTSAAYAQAAREGRGPASAARAEWESGRFPAEDADPAHVLVHGRTLAFEDLMLPAARPDEVGAYWDRDESRRFGRWARRLWDELLALEERERR